VAWGSGRPHREISRRDRIRHLCRCLRADRSRQALGRLLIKRADRRSALVISRIKSPDEARRGFSALVRVLEENPDPEARVEELTVRLTGQFSIASLQLLR
jgi:hypothetical protein